uniref:protein-tyrosine-phosphatase n=1 Tax=Albugo laibachii Nc14 TaxID=890382 RepID=F0WHF1_9STRA|nr:conserved hypothetical protein [Albugo laibachii Nc14]|eukprot:CCA20670.1 conserved hypothetical protein [Albugo laibachii Nc14]
MRSEAFSNWSTKMSLKKLPSLRLENSIVQDSEPIPIVDRVYLGSIHGAYNLDALQNRKITHILNAAGHKPAYPGKFMYLTLHLRDQSDAHLLSCLPVALEFLRQALSDPDGIVFVHCTGGRSRSPAILSAYLMTEFKMTFTQSVEKLRLLRAVIAINDGFQYQLRCLEAAKLDTIRANQVMLQQQLEATMRSSCLEETTGNSLTARGPLFQDESGRINGKVPAQFELCVPHDNRANHTAIIIPALRSMATLFTCKACRTPLVSSSSVVNSTSAELRAVVKCSQKVTESNQEQHRVRSLNIDRRIRASGFAENTSTKVQLQNSVSRNLQPFSPYISDKAKPKQNGPQFISKRLQHIWERCKLKAVGSDSETNLRLVLDRNQRMWQEQMQSLSVTSSQDTQCLKTLEKLFAADSMSLNASFRPSKSFFIEADGSIDIAPLQWLLCQVDSSNSGKLNCPSCHEAIGRWKWKQDKLKQVV